MYKILLKKISMYKNKPLLYLFDLGILHTIVFVVYTIIKLLNLNVPVIDFLFNNYYLLLLTNYALFVLWIKIDNYYKFLSNCLPIILLFTSLINVTYNYLPILFTLPVYKITFVIILSFSGLYTIHFFRSNIETSNSKTSLWESYKLIYKFLKLMLNDRPFIVIIIFTSLLILSLRGIIFINLLFTVSFKDFYLYSMLMFSLCMPTLLIREAISTYYYNNSFNYIKFKKKFNFLKLKSLFLIIIVLFSIKCVIFFINPNIYIF